MIKLFFLGLISTIILANEVAVLSETKQQIIDLTQEQIKENEKINKYDWLSDIDLSASISRDKEDDQSQDYSLSFSQEIFKFGGISSQIEYAKELKKLQLLELNMNTKTDVNSMYSLLIDIKLDEISLKQSMLNIKNSYIDIVHKKSQYKEGDIGISDLNEAIMTKNELKEIEKDLELSKAKNTINLKQYTSKEYITLTIPFINMISKKLFLKKSTSIKYASLETNVNNLSYQVKKSDYLPSVSIDTQYGYASGENIDASNYYTYGLSLSLPLSFTSSNDIQQEKLNYLISKKELTDEINDTNLIYDNALLTIQSYKEKIELAVEDIDLYAELLNVNIEEYNAGYKTIDDVESLKNSKQIRELDIKSYEFYIQKELITLYSYTL